VLPRRNPNVLGDRTRAPMPEVLIKVVSGGSNNLKSIRTHFLTIGRGHHRYLEDDQGEPMLGKTSADRLIEDWDLDLEQLLGCRLYFDRPRRKPLKLVHKIIFSMPAGTSPEGLLRAVRQFAQAEFVHHRYALALHTDDPHPHVHVVTKAVSEHGVRLNIRKATLRSWRQEFARLLTTQAIPAQATLRPARGRRPLIRGPVPSLEVQSHD
jgi:hypothetical protein